MYIKGISKNNFALFYLRLLTGTVYSRRVAQTINPVGSSPSLRKCLYNDFDISGWTDVSIPRTTEYKKIQRWLRNSSYFQGKKVRNGKVVACGGTWVPEQKVYLSFEGRPIRKRMCLWNGTFVVEVKRVVTFPLLRLTWLIMFITGHQSILTVSSWRK